MKEATLSDERPRRGHTVLEFAEAVHVSRTTAYGMVARGDIRCVKVGRKIIIPDTEISRFLRQAS
jgi:excisionase family DNA binding protein